MKTLLKFLFTLAVILGVVSTGCKKEVDPCENVSCLNGGTCNNGNCACSEGYEGSTCGTEERSKFIASYNTTEACPSGNFSYTVGVTTSSTGVSNVIISNFGGYGVNVAASANNSTLTIANQTIDLSGTAATFSGTGQLSGNILTITYTVAANGGSETCTMTCTKI